jgi:ankyrin repeat protein
MKSSFPMHEAVRNKDLEAVRSLDPALVLQKNSKEEGATTPLHICCLVGDMTLLEYMLAKLPESVALTQLQNARQRTPLHCAISKRHGHIARRLLERLPFLLNAQDCQGWTALHVASSCGSLDLAVLLVDQHHADLMVTTRSCSDGDEDAEDGELPPGCLAIQDNRVDVVQFLLEAGLRHDQPWWTLHAARRVCAPTPEMRQAISAFVAHHHLSPGFPCKEHERSS